MMANRAITRRDFVRGTVGAALGASVLRLPNLYGEEKVNRSSRVLVVREKQALGSNLKIDGNILGKMLDDLVIRLTGAKNKKDAWHALFKEDDVIGLVPTRHLNPTHQEIFDVVQTSLVQAGFSADKIVNAQGGPEKAKACSALIAMPGLKAHWLTGIGTVLKNYIMYSGQASDYHDANNARLGEIWNLPFVKGKTKLVLVDAFRPLCDKGPQPDPRFMWNYGGLIAGTDPVAVETICLRIITEKRRALKGEPWPLSPPPLCVEAADKIYGLGTSAQEEISLEQLGWTQDSLL
jgi:hypothetical protein